jgi:WD40 repeat protein
VARLRAWAPGQPTAGLGMLVGPRHLVTCAHVVNAALGRDKRDQRRPGPADQVLLQFPLVPGGPVRTASVTSWAPPPAAGASPGDGDVAGLELTEDAPADARPARFAAEPGRPGTVMRAFGYPGQPPREAGMWVELELKGEVAGELLQAESRSGQSVKAQPGYSGSPVWDPNTGAAGGLLQSAPFAEDPERDAYLLSPAAIARVWPEQFDYLLIPPVPYRGLEPFTADDAGVFFGRDADIGILAAMVRDRPVTVVVGPSGVGKSSLVRAGLVPELIRGQRWSVVVVRPGLDPWLRLAEGLLRTERGGGTVAAEDIYAAADRLRGGGLGRTARLLRSQDRPLLLVVDQFEELLTASEPTDPALLDLLLPPPEAAQDAARIVVTLRADFQPVLQQIPGFHTRLNERLYLLSPLPPAQLREAVGRPAAALGVSFEPGLVDRIVADAADGALSLVQFTLTRLWGTQRRRTITFSGYYELGGVRGALDQFAEEQAARLTGTSPEDLDRVLLRLVSGMAGDARPATRRRVPRAEVPDAQWVVLSRLADARLVMIGADPASGEPYAELAHETLIEAWQRLRELVGDNGEFLRWLGGIQRRMAEGDPLPDARIAEARRWLAVHGDDVPAAVAEFITTSTTAAEARLRELAQARDAAETARQRAEAQARRAQALRLAADAELALRGGRGGTVIALALATESLLAEPTLPGDLIMRRVFAQHPRTVATFRALGPVEALAFSPDGSLVAVGSGYIPADEVPAGLAPRNVKGKALLVEAATGRLRAELALSSRVCAVAFSPDGRRLAVGTHGGVVLVLETATGRRLTRWKRDTWVMALAFSPDGERLAVGNHDGSAEVRRARDGRLLTRYQCGGSVPFVFFSPRGDRVLAGTGTFAVFFDAATSEELGRIAEQISALAMSPDWTRLVCGSLRGSAYLYHSMPDAGEVSSLDRQVLLEGGDQVSAAAFSPDSALVAIGAGDGSVTVFESADGAALTQLRHDDRVYGLSFSSDGIRLLSGGVDQSARVFSVRGPLLARLDQDAVVNGTAFSPDGALAASGARDGTVTIFDPAPAAEHLRIQYQSQVHGVAFSPDGTRLATAGYDRSARILDVATAAELARFEHDSVVHAVAFSPDGTRLATGGGPSGLLLDLTTGAKLTRIDAVWMVGFSPDGNWIVACGENGRASLLDGHSGELRVALIDDRQANGRPVTAASFSPDGRRVALAGESGLVCVYDTADGTPLVRLRDGDSSVQGVAFSPDGGRVAVASPSNGADEGVAIVYAAETGAVLARLRHEEWVPAVAFSPDGTMVATASHDDTARVFDAATGEELARVDHENRVRKVVFSPDGGQVATASDDGTARLFEPRTGAELARLDHESAVASVAFSPDGNLLATGTENGLARIFEAQPGLLIERAAGLMIRPLNPAELRRYSLGPDVQHAEVRRARRS